MMPAMDPEESRAKVWCVCSVQVCEWCVTNSVTHRPKKEKSRSHEREIERDRK
jgi:hypothetical protein